MESHGLKEIRKNLKTQKKTFLNHSWKQFFMFGCVLKTFSTLRRVFIVPDCSTIEIVHLWSSDISEVDTLLEL